MTPSQFLASVHKEFQTSTARFPQPNHTLAKLAEESGEVARAFVRIKEGRGGISHADAQAECIQVAAMAMRLALEGDLDFGVAMPGADDVTTGER